MARQQGGPGWLMIGALVVCLAPLAGCKAPNLSLTRDTPAPVLVAPLRQSREAIPPDGRVTVRDGDNIYAIAARYG
ncbi:MAG: LysM domain-containing protein, partial [Rhodobiaceae bacterium]